MKARIVIVIAFVGVVVTTAGAGAAEGQQGEGMGLKLVANVSYLGGTDFETLSLDGRDYAITGSIGEDAAMRVIDITVPEKPSVAAELECHMSQADIQISHDQKSAIMASDGQGGPDACLMVAKAGFMTVDITNPLDPTPVGVATIPRGSHNTTAHPKKPFVWNSDSDLAGRGEIQIWSIKNPAKPKLVNTVASLPHSPHDITFNRKGTVAATVTISHINLWTTKDPANPTLYFEMYCPGCSIPHDVHFTPDGRFLVVGDEAGFGATYPCPGGALYFYDLQGSADMPIPVLVGMYEPDEVIFADGGQTTPGPCTSHVFDISDNSKFLAVSWYSAGTRYLDMTNPVGAAFGPTSTGGIQELGWFIPEGGVSWASKFHKGPYIYSNDLVRGFDVFKISNQ